MVSTVLILIDLAFQSATCTWAPAVLSFYISVVGQENNDYPTYKLLGTK